MYRTLLTIVLFIPGLHAPADQMTVDFSAKVRMLIGAPVPSAPVGSTITGHIEVDLANLPPNSALGGVLGVYSYFGRTPGFTFSLSFGEQAIRYDSVNASQEGGPGPGIWLQHGPGLFDGLTFTLREQGNPYTVALAVFDHSAPMQLLSGVRFPEDLHASPGTVDVAGVSFSDAGSVNLLDAVVTRLSITTVPEPAVPRLLVLGVTIFAGGRQLRGKKRKDPVAVRTRS